MSLAEIVSKMDDFVWGPVMLILLVGTGIFLTIRLKFRPWRNLGLPQVVHGLEQGIADL